MSLWLLQHHHDSCLPSLGSAILFTGVTLGGADSCSSLDSTFSGEENVHLSQQPNHIFLCLSLPHLVLCLSLKQSLRLGEWEMPFGFSLGYMPVHCGVLFAPLTLSKSLGHGVRGGWFCRENLEEGYEMKEE